MPVRGKKCIHTSSPFIIWIHTILIWILKALHVYNLIYFPDIDYSFSWGFMPLSLFLTSFFFRPSFHLSSCKWGIISLSIFPLLSSLALLYFHHLFTSSLILVGEGESQRTCLFINVTEGSHQRRKKSSERATGRGKGQERGNVTKRKRRQV